MKILVIDGQGGGVGKSLIAALKREMPTQPLIALGTNTQATAAMLKAGADQGAISAKAPTSSWALPVCSTPIPCWARCLPPSPWPSA